MNWYVLTTRAGKELQVKDAIWTQRQDLTVHDIYVLPVQNVYVPDSSYEDHLVSSTSTACRLVFVQVADIDLLRHYLTVARSKDDVIARLMYDVVRHDILVIPDQQMNLFRLMQPEWIDEFIVLSKPFADYAARNERFYIVDGPFKQLEGYKIDLHKEKKLAVSFGNMTLALNSLYKYKVVRVYEPQKDQFFGRSNTQRIICNLIAHLQQFGEVDTAYAALRTLILDCHLHDADITRLERKYKDEHHPLYNFLAGLDAQTAGHLQSLAIHYYANGANPDLHQLIPDRNLLPFLTPHLSTLNYQLSSPNCQLSIINYQLSSPVSLHERIADPHTRTSQVIETTYDAHIGVRPLSDGHRVYADFTTFHHQFQSLPEVECQATPERVRPLSPTFAEVLQTTLDNPNLINQPYLNPDGLAIDITKDEQLPQAVEQLIHTGTAIIEQLLAAPRLAQWRNLLPSVLIHS